MTPPSTSPGEKKSRLAALDGLRGVLAFVVLADHAVMELGSRALALPANISVTIFFFVSGLVLTRQWDGNFARFLAMRFVRLWPLFALTLAAGYALARRRPELLEFVWIPLPRYDANEICPPLWSLFLEAWAALAMPAIVWSARGGAMRSCLCILALVTATIFWVPRDGALRAFESYLVCFVAGAAFARTTPRSPLLESAVPRYLGRISYSLYLTHWLVLRICVDQMGPPGVAVGFLLSIPVAEVMFRFIERPSILLSRRVRAPQPTAIGFSY